MFGLNKEPLGKRKAFWKVNKIKEKNKSLLAHEISILYISFLSSTKKVTVQSYLVLEKNRNVSGNPSDTDTGPEEEYRSETAFNEIPCEALSIF